MKAFAFLLIGALLSVILAGVFSLRMSKEHELLRVKNIIRMEQEAEATRFGMEEAFEKAVKKGMTVGEKSEHPEVFVCLFLKSLEFSVESGYLEGYGIDKELTNAVVIEQSAEKWLAEGFPDLLPLIDNCVKFIEHDDGCLKIGINTNYAFEKPLFSLKKTGFLLKKRKDFGEVYALIPEGRVFC